MQFRRNLVLLKFITANLLLEVIYIEKMIHLIEINNK